MAHRLSLAFLTATGCTPAEAVRIAAETGYDMIGFRLLPSGTEAPYPLMHDASTLNETLAALKDTGIEVGDVEIARLKPQTVVSGFESFLERAARLGARHILVAGDDPDPARLTASFAAFCQLCHGYGLTADLEFMPWTPVSDLATARRIVEGAAQPNGGVLIDALHFDRSTSSLDEVRDLPRNLIHYVQFCDGPPDYDPSDEELIRIARTARLLPGEGNVNCVSLARAIPKDVTISIEIPNLERARQIAPKEWASAAIAATRRVLMTAGDVFDTD